MKPRHLSLFLEAEILELAIVNSWQLIVIVDSLLLKIANDWFIGVAGISNEFIHLGIRSDYATNRPLPIFTAILAYNQKEFLSLDTTNKMSSK